MGMVWVARMATAEQTDEILANPDSAYDFINPEDEVEGADTIDLDKEWHGVHHLLTGSPDPQDGPLSIILGYFEEVGEDNGYGPAWHIPADALVAFSNAFSALDEAELRRRYDPDAMVEAEVYLGDMYQEEGEEGFKFLRERANDLGQFAARGAAKGLGAFAVIT
jgi:hypothetical protein